MTTDRIQNKHTDDRTQRSFLKTGSLESAAFDLPARRKEQQALSSGGVLILVDVENFETVKKAHGGPAASACIKLVSALLNAEVRSTDAVIYLKSGEFVLLLPGTSPESALERVQNLSARLNRLSLIRHGREIPINASVGLKYYRAETRSSDERPR